MKIITFDGLSGVGKTTQNELLCAKLGVKSSTFYDRFYHYAKSCYGVDSVLGDSPSVSLLLSLSQIRFHAENYWRREIVVVDHFHEGLINLAYTNETMQKQGLKLLEHGLLLEPSIRPVASFYLSVPWTEAVKRKIVSRYGARVDENDLKVQAAERDLEKDVMFKNYYKWVASELSYFHFIDGNRPPDDIHAEIWGIVQEVL